MEVGVKLAGRGEKAKPETRKQTVEERRDFSLRRPTHSQERMRKKKSACSVRNDGVVLELAQAAFWNLSLAV